MQEHTILLVMEVESSVREDRLNQIQRFIQATTDVYTKAFNVKAQVLTKDPIFSIKEAKEKIIENFENAKNVFFQNFQNYSFELEEIEKWVKDRDNDFKEIIKIEDHSIKDLYQKIVAMEQKVHELKSKMSIAINILNSIKL